jgi:hypothetical protein
MTMNSRIWMALAATAASAAQTVDFWIDAADKAGSAEILAIAERLHREPVGQRAKEPHGMWVLAFGRALAESARASSEAPGHGAAAGADIDAPADRAVAMRVWN